MAPIRLIQVIAQLGVGGSEHQLLRLCANLDRSRYDVRVISLVRDGALKLDFAAAGVEVIDLDRRDLGGPIGQIRALAAQLRSWKPQLVQSWLRKAIHATRAASILAGHRGLITTNRDLGGGYSFWDTALDLVFLPITDLYLHNSEAGLRSFVSRVPLMRDSRHHLWRNGIDTRALAPDPLRRANLRRERGIGADQAVVVLLARLFRIKDPQLFLEVAREVCAQKPETRFWLVGGGPLESEMRRRLADDPLDAFEILGERKDAGSWLNAADLAMSTSRSEGLSNTILEAMSYSLPVVATDVGGNSELVTHGENGLILSSRDPRDIAKRVLRLLDDRDAMAAMGRRGRQRAENEFSIAKLLASAEEFYAEVLERRRRG